MHTTGYYTHSDCLLHDMGGGHPECPQRLLSIQDRLISSGLEQVLQWPDCALATVADLSLAHDASYIEKIFQWDAELNDEAAVKAVTGVYKSGLESLKSKLEKK